MGHEAAIHIVMLMGQFVSAIKSNLKRDEGM